MMKFRLRSRSVLLLLASVIGYNYFLGSPDEKMEARNIASQVKDLGTSLQILAEREIGKYEKGKYDPALQNLGDFILGLKSGVTSDTCSSNLQVD